MKTICKFSKNMLVKSQKSKQRIVEVCRVLCAFVGYLLERKIYFLRSCPFGVFSSASTWGHKIFSIIFKILWQWKVERAIVEQKFPLNLPFLLRFAAYLLRGLFLQILYNSRIFVLINEIIKCFFNYLAGFRRSHRLPIEEIYFRRTNLAFSIRYISDQISRLNLRHGRVRQSMGSMDR